jgi:site-specific DNA-methyltransferase (adenine-specific)
LGVFVLIPIKVAIRKGGKDLETRITLGSSAKASKLAPDLIGKISLAVTSPPYHNAINYKDHAKDPTANYRSRYSQDYANEYMTLLNSIWDETHTMLRAGGYFAVNVGSVLDNGYHYPLGEDIISELTKNSKWGYVRTIFWNKVTAGVIRAGSVIQHPFPAYWHPNIMTEHIILVRKHGPIREPNSDIPKEWNQTVWDLAPVPPKTVNHPAPYPEDLPHRLIRMFTNEEDWVMDPFNGAGATTKAATDLGRSSIGFDIEKKYIALAKSRQKNQTSVRPRQLRVVPVHAKDFVAGPSRGKTRYGAGLGAKKK